MEDWRTGNLRERQGRSEAVMLKVARQRKWVHWVHWCFPIWSFIGCIISAIQIRDWRPLAASFAMGVLIGLAGGGTGGAALLLFFVGGIPFAFWTQQIIQDTRDDIDRMNRR